jgi:hypothetical protein
VHSIDIHYLSTVLERDLAFARLNRTSHLGGVPTSEDNFQSAPQPRRRLGWLAGFPRPAAG